MSHKIGPNGEYTLSDAALNHIINGDLTDRHDKDNNNNTVLRKIISGGLHTLDAWYNFLNHRSDVKNALLFEPNNEEKWYYLRELHNKVILLKIPRECFQSKAAKLTEFPQTYYKSGYLWKTLFPRHLGRDQIIDCINEALNNIDTAESKDSILIGYTKPNDFWEVIKIRIQIVGLEINSAFPTWDQPMTGNNGKPFSHLDSINTIIAESTLMSEEDLSVFQSNTINSWSNITLEDLYQITPEFIKNRKPPKKNKTRSFQNKNWKFQLCQISNSLSEEEIKRIFDLLMSDSYLRYPFDLIRFFYNNGPSFKLIKDRLKYRNAASIFENIHDLLVVLNHWDIQNNRKLSPKVIFRLMSIHFIRTGGLNQWEIKRLSNLFFELLSKFEDSDKIHFLKKLQSSPLRVGLYVEFNLNPYLQKNPGLIGVTEHEDIPLKTNWVYDFIIQNLGINYIRNFDDSFNINFIKKILALENKQGDELVKDIVSHALASDFNYFSVTFSEFVESISITKELIMIIEEIVFDYHRCLAANVQRIIVKYNDILCKDLDFDNPKAIYQIHCKHEYQFLWVINNLMIEKLSELFINNGFTQEGQALTERYLSLYKEAIKIPMPKPVPKYLVKDQDVFEKSILKRN